MNAREKWMIKLAMEKLLITGLIKDDPKHCKFIQVHENELISICKFSKRI